RKILVLINPFGGTGQAVKIFNTIAAPMFRLAGVETEVIHTKYREHATEIGRALDVSEYSAAITVSGDGVLHELINGLASRPDWQESCKLPVGIIGGGSANAMGKNLDTLFPELATLSIIKGETRPMDVFSVTQNGTVTYSHLAILWALLGDLDIESDEYRWFGAERFTLAAIIRLIRLRTYRAKLYLLPSAETSTQSRAETIDIAPDRPLLSHREGYRNHGPPRIHTGPDSDYTDWRVIDSTFTFFVATNLPYISSEFLTAPQSRLNDGGMDVVWSETMNTMDGFRTVLDQGSGKYRQFPFLRSERCKAFVLEPEGWRGILDVSGEEVPYAPIKVEVHPALVSVIAPRWLDEDRMTGVKNVKGH
ncbi:ATP-NAD kinase-like domain-containing protein, partial [Blyttiomyces helicus]